MTISANIKNVLIRETEDRAFIKKSKLLRTTSFKPINLLISLTLIAMSSSGMAQDQEYSSITNSSLRTSPITSSYSQGTISVVKFNFNNTGIERGSLRAFPDADSRFGEFANSPNQDVSLVVSSTASRGGPLRDTTFEPIPISELSLGRIKPLEQAISSLKKHSTTPIAVVAKGTDKSNADSSS